LECHDIVYISNADRGKKKMVGVENLRPRFNIVLPVFPRLHITVWRDKKRATTRYCQG